MFDPDVHHRRSIRLPGYDYSRKGHYYVTICVLEKQCLFGEVTDGRVLLSDLGKMIDATWLGLPAYNPGVQMDSYVVMPNHLHGIMVLSGEGRARTRPYLG